MKHCLVLVVLLLFGSQALAQPANPEADSLRRRAQRALKARQYAAAGQLYYQLGTRLAWRSPRAGAHYAAACAYAQAGDAPAALAQLRLACRDGWHDASWAGTDADLASLRALPAFRRLVHRMERAQARQRDPDRARLVTADIDHFWQAYDRAARDTARRAAIYERDYFGRASLGLQDYYASRIMSVPKFVRNLDQKPAFYRAVRPTTEQVAALTPQIRAGFRRLKELYPAAHFPDVYFVIGRYSAAGTVSRNGLLISADMLAGGPQVPVHELSGWERSSLTAATDLRTVVAHEHIHQLQHFGSDQTLLRGAIEEGMANFLAELTTGRHLQARQHAYGLAHEPALWQAFQQEMRGEKWDNWLFNGEQETADHPSDLGYFIGYRICEAYYERMPDKKQAVHDMLNITDFSDFLARSRYTEKISALLRNP